MKTAFLAGNGCRNSIATVVSHSNANNANWPREIMCITLQATRCQELVLVFGYSHALVSCIEQSQLKCAKQLLLLAVCLPCHGFLICGWWCFHPQKICDCWQVHKNIFMRTTNLRLSQHCTPCTCSMLETTSSPHPSPTDPGRVPVAERQWHAAALTDTCFCTWHAIRGGTAACRSMPDDCRAGWSGGVSQASKSVQGPFPRGCTHPGDV